MLQALLQRINRAKEQRRATDIHDVKELVAFGRRAANGETGIELNEEFYAQSMERLGVTEADLLLNDRILSKRQEQAKLAAKVPELQKQAQRAEEEWRTAKFVDWPRIMREWHEKLNALEASMTRAIAESNQAAGAQSDLIAGAEVTDKERALNADLAGVNSRLAAIRDALNPNAQIFHNRVPTDGAMWASLHTHPAKLAAQIRAMLDDTKTGYSPERRKQLEAQLSAAEKAVGEWRAKLAAAEKEQAKITKQLSSLNDAKLLPESFVFKRATQDQDVLMKQHAAKMGFHSGSGISVHTG